MTAAIIAAGRGERLRAGGITTPKPLLPVGGVQLIDRLFAAIAAAGIGETVCLLNEIDDDVADHCRRSSNGQDLQIVRTTTPNSMESLFALAPALGRGRFLLLTVDAVFGPDVLPTLLRIAADHTDAAGVLAAHRFVDDEKPLWIAADANDRVCDLGTGAATSGLISAGLYVFDTAIFAEIGPARTAGCRALRHFIAHLHRRGYELRVARVGKTIDVDRPADLAAADAFVAADFAE